MKICGVYKITNTITGDFYIGSSKDVKQRWSAHKCKSSCKRHSNNPMYLDMQKYGVDKFAFEILEEVETEQLKEAEQKFIELLKPTYNNRRANGWDTERYKENKKEYRQTEKGREVTRKANRKVSKRYDNRLCLYNGEILRHQALRARFYRAGVEHSAIEANKYLIK